MSHNGRAFLVSLVLLGVAGCGDDDGSPDASTPDASTTDGATRDAATLDSGSSLLCTNTCGPAGSPGEYAGDGECDDGGEGSTNASCALGTDCTDCGSRMPQTTDGGPPQLDSGARDAGSDAMMMCGDLSGLAAAAARWGASLDEWAASCCDQAQACAIHLPCPNYHACLRDCFEGAPDQECIRGCQADHAGFNEGMVYERFSACIR